MSITSRISTKLVVEILSTSRVIPGMPRRSSVGLGEILLGFVVLLALLCWGLLELICAVAEAFE